MSKSGERAPTQVRQVRQSATVAVAGPPGKQQRESQAMTSSPIHCWDFFGGDLGMMMRRRRRRRARKTTRRRIIATEQRVLRVIRIHCYDQITRIGLSLTCNGYIVVVYRTEYTEQCTVMIYLYSMYPFHCYLSISVIDKPLHTRPSLQIPREREKREERTPFQPW